MLKSLLSPLPYLTLLLLSAIDLSGRAPKSSAAVRILPLDETAWAGSSVNVVGGQRQAVFTDGVKQYAAYYDGEGFMVLAKRKLGDDSWQTVRTEHQGDVANAHNSISIAVDGAGILHVAWDHHNRPLKYARALEPGSLGLGPIESMIGEREDRVTYPQFVRLPEGDLLFLYRAGGSGNGSLVLNRFVMETREWRRLHDNLIDGEGRRSPYWDLAVDGNGVLHLAWNWRDSPDVATNHDLAFARSDDRGFTWRRTDGTAYALPITEGSAEYAVRIPPGRNLMNPPSVAADRESNPFITSYWSPAKGAAPRHHLVYFREGGWHVTPGPKSATNFVLKGEGTKAPPWSRAALLVDQPWSGIRAHLIYRDDDRGGWIIAATVDIAPEPKWTERVLVGEPSGGWEPSLDPIQAGRLRQAHLLLQAVAQVDGDDEKGAEVPPTPIGLLVWNPDWERHLEPEHHRAEPPTGDLDRPLSAAQVRDLGTRAADWQWQSLAAERSRHHPRSWVWAPFYIGTLAFAAAADIEPLQTRMRELARSLYWKPHHRMYDADDHCVIQAYAELYRIYQDEEMIRPARERLDGILKHPSPSNLDWGSTDARDRWSWCDALFMGPPSWIMLWEITGDDRYLDFMNREWWATTDRLYNVRESLYFRDESYLDVREPNGKTVHWSRGNGWAFAGLARVLERFPENHADYPRYLKLFREMSAALRRVQQSDGLWRAGLLDPEAHPARETSGSSFITFGLAWGLNHGILDQSEYAPVVRRAWNALGECVNEEGRLEHVQPIGAAPHGFDPSHSEPFAVGAFLLAASEVLRLAD